MRLLLWASVVLILASGATLAVGWANANEQLMWSSIALSAATALCLAVAYFRNKHGTAHPAPGGPAGPPSASGAGAEEKQSSSVEYEAWGAPARSHDAKPTAAETPADAGDQVAPAGGHEATDHAAPEAGPVTASLPSGPSAPATGRSASKPKPKPQMPAEEVVAVPERMKFHRPECRYAKTSGERMSKAQARRRSFSACGICKP